MRTARNTDAIMRRKKYDLIRMSETCQCGGYKWVGTAFCHACLNQLNQKQRSALFTSDPVRFPDAWDSAAAALNNKGGTHGQGQ